MNPVLAAAKEVCDFMAERRWDFCVIGGLAVQRWGRPRTTLDADMTLMADWGEEEVYVTAILEQFTSRVSDAREFAETQRVLLIQASNGGNVDVALGALPFEADMVRRATDIEFEPGLSLRCCTAEDLFVMKAFAGRSQDWFDAEGIVARQDSLDRDYILDHLTGLCELRETPETLERAKQLLVEET